MIEHVYRRAALAPGVSRVIVATDDLRIATRVAEFGGNVKLTKVTHRTGTDRLAEVAASLDCDVVVNVQGDEPLIDPGLIDAVAGLLRERPQASMSTAAHAIDDVAEFSNPNVVKVVCDAEGRALFFSRAPLPWWRDGYAAGLGVGVRLSEPPPLRHIGLYAYRAAFLQRYPTLAPAPIEAIESLEQLRVLWHGERIAVHVSLLRPGPGVDTPEDLQRVRAILGASG